MSKRPAPFGHARRGKWLETAVLASDHVYRRRRIGYVVKQPVEWRQKIVNGEKKQVMVKSAVDFVGVHAELPLAFDAKVTGDSSVRREAVQDHQLEMLDLFTACGGVGFLLISFDRPSLGKTFACTSLWFQQTLARLSHRASIPFDTFVHDAGDGSKECCEVFHGVEGVPVNFGPAAWKLRLAINAKP